MIKELENISDTVCSITTADRINDKWENEKDYNIEHDVLLPCPKCGGVPDLRGNRKNVFGRALNSIWIICTHCGEICSNEIGLCQYLFAGKRGTNITDFTVEQAVTETVRVWNEQSSLSEYKAFQHPKKVTIFRDRTHYLESWGYKFPYRGDCLTGIGIPYTGTLNVDNKIEPAVGDLVLCQEILAGNELVKQVIDITDDSVIVGTRYADSSRDFTFVAGEIFGTVTKVFDKFGDIVYESESTKAEV